MATTHVLIVDSNTLKYHLEYMFIGTGAGNKVIDFNNIRTTKLHSQSESSLLGMIADISRIKVKDKILFYLQQDPSEKIYDGKFFGIFNVVSEPFLENLTHVDNIEISLQEKYNLKFPSKYSSITISNKNNQHKISINNYFDKEKFLKKIKNTDDKEVLSKFIDDYFKKNQYLLKDLKKSLTFRIKIEADNVYANGITEWEALDDIKSISTPTQMLWSLIYRKLKGARGNTMITLYESDSLIQLIRNKNGRNTIYSNHFTFNSNNQKIEAIPSTVKYTGKQIKINILPRLVDKYCSGLQFETHLQAYILQNISQIQIFNNENIEWIGNEVSCGVGMRRIDIMLSSIRNGNKTTIPIELKSTEAYSEITIQLQRYIDWIHQYYYPNHVSDIEPIIISRKVENKNSQEYKDILISFNNFNSVNNNINKLRYVEFNVDCQSKTLSFNEINY